MRHFRKEKGFLFFVSFVAFVLLFYGCSQNSGKNVPVGSGEITDDSLGDSVSSAQIASSGQNSSLPFSYSSVSQAASEPLQEVVQSSAASSQIYDTVSNWVYSDSGFCLGGCDNSEPVEPKIYSWVATGNITTYGSITDPQPSRGGACNFGDTRIMQFAAINVNIKPGDNQGQWQNGAICGQCVEVRARTSQGWRTTIVRIVDKCPDDNCGIDLGGTATEEIMGNIPGRYSGEWRFVDCPESDLISDGSPHVYVKDGSSVHWALIQVRNPVSSVISISWRERGQQGVRFFDRATEAENFFSVPVYVMANNTLGTLTVYYANGTTDSVDIFSQELSIAYNEIDL